MGIVGVHPAVFVRVASKGVTGYGTWKSAQAIEETGRKNVRTSKRLDVRTSVDEKAVGRLKGLQI
jgi:hypothetical protein